MFLRMNRKGQSTRYDCRIRFVFWGMELNADDSISVDYIRTAFRTFQNANRIRQSYRVE